MKVIFTGCSKEQQKFGQYADHSILEVGKEYEVIDKEVHTWHTRVTLKGVDGQFNSVCFTEIENEM